jgi:Ca2+-binding RTX toxin-like protein
MAITEITSADQLLGLIDPHLVVDVRVWTLGSLIFEERGEGSGTYLGANIILTAAHVIFEDDGSTIAHLLPRSLESFQFHIGNKILADPITLNEGTFLNLGDYSKSSDFFYNNDIGLVFTDQSPNPLVSAPSFIIYEDSSDASGEIFAVGYPQKSPSGAAADSAYISTGTLASNSYATNLSDDPIWIASIALAPGFSGGGTWIMPAGLAVPAGSKYLAGVVSRNGTPYSTPTGIEPIGDVYSDLASRLNVDYTAEQFGNHLLVGAQSRPGQLIGTFFNESILGGTFSDDLRGDGGADTITGGTGGDDLYGGSGDDLLRGGDQADYLKGEGDNDSLEGQADNDILYGDGGDDTLNGGDGSDVLYGGLGADLFQIVPGAGGVVRIADYRQGNRADGSYAPDEADRVDLSALSFTTTDGRATAAHVRVVEQLGAGFASLQVNLTGQVGSSNWATVAQLDGVRSGQAVTIAADPSGNTSFNVTAIATAGVSGSLPFDFPIGAQDGNGRRTATPAYDNDGWYVASGFGAHYPEVSTSNLDYHLGEDWNVEGSASADVGRAVYAIADGEVVFAGPGGSGWGGVVILKHVLPDGAHGGFVTSMYAHLVDPTLVRGAIVRQGDAIGAIGDGGPWSPHLHFEIREGSNPDAMLIGHGYSAAATPDGWLDPTAFILARRGAVAQSAWSITPAAGSATEGGAPLSFTITRSSTAATDTVYVSTIQSHGSRNLGDYGSYYNHRIDFAVGQASRTISIDINEDMEPEGNETFGLIVQQRTTDPLNSSLARATFTILDSGVATQPGLGQDWRGTTLAERKTGSNGNDSLFGYGGGDTLIGRGGNDYLEGTDGDDSLSGGSGHDTLNAQGGQDTLRGGSGDDVIWAGRGRSLIDGGTGTDRLWIAHPDLTASVSIAFVSDGLAAGTYNFTMPQGTVVRSIEWLSITTGSGDDAVAFGNLDLLGELHQGTIQNFDGGGGVDTALLDFSAFSDAVTATAMRGGAYSAASQWSPQWWGAAPKDGVTLTGVEKLNIIGGSGNDSIDGATGNDTIIGGSGDDTLTGGEGDDSLTGGAGNDWLTAGGGIDVLDGGTGNDLFSEVTYGDVINGGSGIDTVAVNASDYTAAITINLLTGQGAGAAWTGIEFATGTLGEGDDSFTAGIQLANLNGGGGVDTLTLDYSGTLADGRTATSVNLINLRDLHPEYVDFSTGASALFYLSAFERFSITGTVGNDHITSGGLGDTLIGGSGDDTLTGGEGDDSLTGGAGNDWLTAGRGIDVLDGGTGNDLFSEVTYGDVINGGSGIDTVAVNASDYTAAITINLLTGQGAGAAWTGIEFATGTLGEGDDSFTAGIQLANLNGGGGVDTLTLDYSGTLADGRTATSVNLINLRDLHPEYVDFSTGASALFYLSAFERFSITGTVGNDHITSGGLGDTLIGGSGDDTLTGGEGDDSLTGGAGNDWLTAGRGIDVLDGGTGNDLFSEVTYGDEISGGAGTDTVFFNLDGQTAAITINLLTGQGAGAAWTDIEFATGTLGEGDDSFTAGIQLANLNGDSGIDTLTLDYSGSLADGRTVIVVYFHTLQTNNHETVILSDGAQIDFHLDNFERFSITGSTGDDQIRGGALNDTLSGGAGNDMLSAGEGQDLLDGGAGHDTFADVTLGDEISGGAGTDTVIFNLDGQTAAITINLLTGQGAGAAWTDIEFATGTLGEGDDSFTAGIQLANLNGDSGIDTLTLDYSGSLADGRTVTVVYFYTLQTNNHETVILSDGAQIDFHLDNFERFSITGSTGDDQIVGGALNDTLSGGAGNDMLSAGEGQDLLDGGAGHDTFADVTLGDEISGGAGTDTVIFNLDGQTAAITINLLTGQGAGAAWTDIEFATGTLGEGDDSFTAGIQLANLNGDSGIDTLTLDYSGSLADGRTVIVIYFHTLQTNNHETVILSDGAQIDFHLDNFERFSITGSTGDDQIRGGALNDTLSGGAGNDMLSAGEGQDLLDGGAGHDTFADVTLGDEISGGAGTDTVIFNLDGQTAAITINLLTGQGAGAAWTDIEFATGTLGEGDDSFTAGIQLANLNGDSGIDTLTLDYSGSLADGRTVIVVYFHTLQTNNHETVILSDGAQIDFHLDNFERFSITGSTGDDQIRGGALNDTLSGGAGNDWLTAGRGIDVLDGGTGNDLFSEVTYGDEISGGAGTDTVFFNLDGQTAAITINLLTGQGAGAAWTDIEFATGTLGEGDDSFTAGIQLANLNGDSGIDTLTLDYSGSLADGRTVTVVYFYTLQTNNHETVILSDGAQIDFHLDNFERFSITGSTGDDQIRGGALNDTLSGGAGNDMLSAGEGQDLLDGGAGHDTFADVTLGDEISGGAGTDTVIFNLDGQTAAITINLLTGQGAGAAWTDIEFATGTLGEGDDSFTAGIQLANLNGDSGIDTLTLDYSGSLADGRTVIVIYFHTLQTNNHETVILSDGAQIDFHLDNFERFNITGSTGDDQIAGGALNDTLSGDAGNDMLSAGEGDDSLTGGAGNDMLTGGGGMDVAIFSGPRARYTITRDPSSGTLTVSDQEESGDGTDTLASDIETLRFSDVEIAASSFVPTLAVQATSGTKAEGNSGPTSLLFTLTRGGDTSAAASVDYAVTGSDANPANAADFVGNALPAGSISFSAGEISKVIAIEVLGDSDFESDESFTLTLSNPSGTQLGVASASGTILNDDPTRFSVAASSATKAEGNAGSTSFTFTISRVGDLSAAHSVAWSVTSSDVDPVTTLDFQGGVLPSGNVTFAAGETSKVISVLVAGDTAFEQAEGFIVSLSTAAPGLAIGIGTAQGVIQNDDIPGNTGTIGSAGDDTLTGTAAGEAMSGLGGRDMVDGAGGNDTIRGDQGDDTLFASTGNDALDGGAGIDTLDFGSAFSTINVFANLALGIAQKGTLGDDTLVNLENITGNAGNDSLTGNGLNNALIGSGGDDVLAGGLGNDVLTGGLGVDRFEVDTGTDTVTDLGLGGADVLLVFGGATANAALAAAWTATAASNVSGIANLTANGFNVDLSAAAPGLGFWSVTNAGNGTAVRFAGSVNADALTGGEGNDSLLGGASGDTLSGNGGTDSLSGGGGNDSLNGGADNDTLLGEADEDSLTGGAGDDRMTGGAGTDRFAVDAGTDTITDLGLGGADVLVVWAGATANATLAGNWTFTLGSNNGGTANITAAGFNADLGQAAGSAGWAVSNLGTNRAVSLTGSARNDTLTGGNGNDTLTGGGANDSLLGDAGSDSLTGGTGNDTMTGGAAVDRFVVDAGTDTITDLAAGGNDVLVVSTGATANATLGGGWTASSNVSNAGVVNITAAGFNVNLTAATGLGTWSVTQAGQAGAVVFAGSVQGDRLTGGLGADSLAGNAGDDTLTGGDGADTLNGGAGVDSLVGGLGNDSLTGGAEVDRFLVESGTDTITDLGFGGTDALVIQAGAAVVATIGGHWTASGGSSNAGSASVFAAGFNVNVASVGGASGWALSNAGQSRGVSLVGSGNADSITGGSGADTLRGQGGADSLSGGGGNDQLFGGAGNDTMTGGAGIDRFTVDAGTDVITDLGAGGVDVVIVSAGATLQAMLAADWVATAASSNGGVANLSTAGFDVNLAAAGGSLGWDVSATTADAVALTGSRRADVLMGGAGADTLIGGAGNDTLAGGLGADALTGGLGADHFRFDTVAQANGDIITDISAAQGDMIDLRVIDANASLGGDQAFTYLGGAAFTNSAGQLRFQSGVLQGDVNGDGAADFQMQLTGVTSLAVANIWL